MGTQLHKRITEEVVKEILDRYVHQEINLTSAIVQLGVKRSRFFRLLKRYRKEGKKIFSVAYVRATPARITETNEKLLKSELIKEHALVVDPKLPIHEYNYSAIRDTLRDRYGVKVSVPTIIARAKKLQFYLPRKEKRIHDREVITNYVGELIQHDASVHHWSPYVTTPWHAITSIDDHSRLLVFADLFEHENRWHHICSVESVVLNYGVPKSYYADQHSIFRFVEKRDSLWKKNVLETDAVDPEWKRVLKILGINPIYALSPQAKGKIERPYRWLQARTVRRCAQDQVTKFVEVRQIFREEVERYNMRQVHSTTKEIPIYRFEKAIKEGRTMFRRFEIIPPYQSTKDIFCLMMERVVDSYRTISLQNIKIRVPKAPPKQTIMIHLVPDTEKKLVEVRLWWKQELVSTQIFKEQELPLVRF